MEFKHHPQSQLGSQIVGAASDLDTDLPQRSGAVGAAPMAAVPQQKPATMGATVSVDASAFEQLTVPPCPEEFVAFVKETPLERLVYWKLRDFFSKIEGDLPANVLKVVLTHIERPLFSLVLEKTEGNQSKAAEVLGCNRNTLHRKLKDLAIAPMELRKVLRKERTRRRFKQLVTDKLERVVPGLRVGAVNAAVPAENVHPL